MRWRLCEAALDVLSEVGYERLSTPLISARAQVSRGAQTHHFPTKADILVGAFEHLLKRWEKSRVDFLAYHPPPAPLDSYLRHIWYGVFAQPSYIAALELMLAARADEALRERLQAALAEWTEKRDEIWSHLIGFQTTNQTTSEFLRLNLCMFRGMAIHASFNKDDTINDALLEAWIKIAKQIAPSSGGPERPQGGFDG